MSDMPDQKVMVEAALSFLDQVEVMSSLADSKYVAGWVVVRYDPETDEWSASGLFDHPQKANEMAQSSEAELTRDGSPGTCRMVLPVYDWDVERKTDERS